MYFLQSDSSNVISYLMGKMEPLESKKVMNTINALCAGFKEFKCMHASRETNRLAGGLAALYEM